MLHSGRALQMSTAKALRDLLAMLAVARLGVELHAPHATGLIDKGSGKPVLRLPDDAETRGSFRDRVPVTHPRHEGVPGNAREELRLFLQQYAGPAVLLAAEGGHGPAVIRAHALEAIANPQHGEAFFIDALVRARGAFLIHGERGTREDDAADVAEIDARERRVTGHDPAEYAELPNPASDELRALASKVENQDQCPSDRKLLPNPQAHLGVFLRQRSGLFRGRSPVVRGVREE